MRGTHLALVGDYDVAILAHRAISRALELASGERRDLHWQWLPTEDVAESGLKEFDGIWLVPGSPYRSLEGALCAARFAREHHRAFLGTCGGFQHALIEYAEHVAGIPSPQHAEISPLAESPLIAPLECRLVEVEAGVRLAVGSRLHRAYGTESTNEGYHCRYGLNPVWQKRLEASGLRWTAWDASGDVRGAEWPEHPWFVGTLFQPERRALRNELPPVVRAFVDAAASVSR